MTVAKILTAVLIIAALLLLSQWIRRRVALFRRLFLPSSIIAGFIALLLGSQVLGGIVSLIRGEDPSADHLTIQVEAEETVDLDTDNDAGRDSDSPQNANGSEEEAQVWSLIEHLSDGIFGSSIEEIWRAMPALLISIVFAALFLGKPIPGIREIWLKAGPQVVFGQTVAWGQYVVGLILALLILTPLFGISPIAGALIEIGFEGGHGTAGGMAPLFEQAGFPEGTDLALGLATIGIVGGVLIGTIAINIAVRHGVIVLDADGEPAPADAEAAARDLKNKPESQDLADLQRELDIETTPTDPFSLHVGVVALAIGVGWLLLQALIWIESVTWKADLMDKMPLFPLAMIGGVIVQMIADRTGFARFISRRMMARISGTTLDFIIVAALATLSLQALGENVIPFILLALAGIAWCVFALIYIAPFVIPYNWFERGVCDFGQSMGVTVTGLLLLRMSDPKNKSGTLESFGYKQLLFEPFVGGGVFTAMSVPLIFNYGPVAILIFTSIVMVGWLIFGYFAFGRLAREQRALERAGPE